MDNENKFKVSISSIDGKRTQQIGICYDLAGILPMSLLKQNSEAA